MHKLNKGQFHCIECGLCRVGKEGVVFKHCSLCGCCRAEDHECKPEYLNNLCPICSESLFNSQSPAVPLRCNHMLHEQCLVQYLETNYKCPLCSKAICDMTRINEMIEQEVQNTIMPEELRREVTVLCNECLNRSQAQFHIVGIKCGSCGSYNTVLA